MWIHPSWKGGRKLEARALLCRTTAYRTGFSELVGDNERSHVTVTSVRSYSRQCAARESTDEEARPFGLPSACLEDITRPSLAASCNPVASRNPPDNVGSCGQAAEAQSSPCHAYRIRLHSPRSTLHELRPPLSPLMDHFSDSKDRDAKRDVEFSVHVAPVAELDNGTALIQDHAAERALCRKLDIHLMPVLALVSPNTLSAGVGLD